jgi:hypothetical protein
MLGRRNCGNSTIRWVQRLPVLQFSVGKEPRKVRPGVRVYLDGYVCAGAADYSQRIAPIATGKKISVIFGMAIMPLTYYPILKIAADGNVMGKHVNGRMATIIGTVFLLLITVAAVAVIPLMILTHSGKP